MRFRPRWGRLRRRLTPPRLLAGSFLTLILVGTVALRTLPGLYMGEPLGWVDALFTATSAVCVTGLIVVDTATYFTGAGQAVLLVLIQLGGLGLLTFTTLVILGLGRRLSLHHEGVVAGGTRLVPAVDFRRLQRHIVVFTLGIEALAALVLFLAWLPRFGTGEALWHAVFHAVSAFCNAGFSTFSDSLVGFSHAPVTLVTVMGLVVAGGLGFLALEETAAWWRSGRAVRLSVHTRLVLGVSLMLLMTGWLLYGAFEWHITLEGMPAWAKATNALFMSVTARTAGFNTVDYAQTAEATSFLTIILMSIGGAPGSTAGGLKVTTVAVIGLLALARLRGRALVSLWHRTIPEETIQRAVGLFVFAFGLTTLAIFVYTLTEIGFRSHTATLGSFLAYMFETTSAFNTVGLSMGVTDELSSAGRLLTTLLMYVGRVGPLSFAAAIALRDPLPGGGFRYAYEDVVIG